MPVFYKNELVRFLGSDVTRGKFEAADLVKAWAVGRIIDSAQSPQMVTVNVGIAETASMTEEAFVDFLRAGGVVNIGDDDGMGTKALPDAVKKEPAIQAIVSAHAAAPSVKNRYVQIIDRRRAGGALTIGFVWPMSVKEALERRWKRA